MKSNAVIADAHLVDIKMIMDTREHVLQALEGEREEYRHRHLLHPEELRTAQESSLILNRVPNVTDASARTQVVSTDDIVCAQQGKDETKWDTMAQSISEVDANCIQARPPALE